MIDQARRMDVMSKILGAIREEVANVKRETGVYLEVAVVAAFVPGDDPVTLAEVNFATAWPPSATATLRETMLNCLSGSSGVYPGPDTGEVH